MNTSLSMFLILAEELNFSRAAQKAFVTQQALSDHIKRLELKYGTPLFNRRPKVTLTPAGQALLQTARRIQVIEDGFQHQLQDLEAGNSGTLRVGLTFARSHIFIPLIVPAFRSAYPQVKLSFQFGDTNELMELLRRGEIDCLLGINAPADPVFCAIPLCQEHVYFVASDRYLQTYLPQKTGQFSEETGIAPQLLQNLPMARNSPGSTLSDLIERFLDLNQISLFNAVSVSEYSIQIALCAQDQVAIFCPTIALNEVRQHNRLRSPDNQLRVFPIVSLNDTLQTDLLYNAEVYHPAYVRGFFSVAQAAVEQSYTGSAAGPRTAVDPHK